jgi:hypothetical protein
VVSNNGQSCHWPLITGHYSYLNAAAGSSFAAWRDG